MKKRDENEAEIVMALRQVGAEVWRSDDWDLTVAFRGRWHCIEVKTNEAQSKRKTSTAERQREHRDRAERCGCTIPVVWSVDMALAAIGAIL